MYLDIIFEHSTASVKRVRFVRGLRNCSSADHPKREKIVTTAWWKKRGVAPCQVKAGVRRNQHTIGTFDPSFVRRDARDCLAVTT
jgi:hypothetical protein